ncbi:ATP-binding protein [Myxococcota bacterium]|nr:ATP-binding protein [Myxococcota bacterium]
MRALCRVLDWSRTPLGPVAAWPESLRSVVRLCLDAKTTMAVFVGPDLVLIPNERFRLLLGRRFPAAVARPAAEVWPQLVTRVTRDLRRVYESGVALRREDQRFEASSDIDEGMYCTYSMEPIHGERGVLGVMTVIEHVHRVRGASRERAIIARGLRREANLGLVNEVSEAWGRAATAEEVIGIIGARLGRHLGLATCHFVEIDEAAERGLVSVAWCAPGARSVSGVHVIADYIDDATRRGLCRGETLVLHDTQHDPRANAARFAELEIGAVIAVPHGQLGEWRDLLVVTTAGPRDWRADEVELVEELAARVYPRFERAKAEELLREADRRKDHFLAVLAHELRNPLTPVQNSLHLLGRAPPGSELATRARDVITRQIEQLSHLVDDLLDVTRISRGKIRLQRARLELNTVAARTIEDHESLFAAAGVELRLERHDFPVYVDADEHRIAQVLSNLLTNAAKFTPAGGRVTVHVAEELDGDRAVLSVRDTGVGMAPELLAHLFEPFMQADASLDRRMGGLGLGLALVKGFVEMHGGTVVATSAGPGRGSELTVRLPLDRTTRTEAEPAAVTPMVRRRVLIVEDNVDAADSLRAILELDGHEVEVAYTGRSGIEKARALHPDFVLCDIGLPEVDGYGVARALRDDPELVGVRLIALSGYARPEDQQRARVAGFERHLAKPPSIEKLESILCENGAPRASG